MGKLLTIADTREMSKTKIQITLGEYTKELEKLGMDHVSACEFLSSVMNLGIAAQEKHHNKNLK
jgi:hypothetical protein